MNDTQRILSDNIIALFYRFSIPSIIGMLAVASASIIDGIFVGNYVGANALAAISLSSPLHALFFGLVLMLAVGGMVSAGKYLGADNRTAASVIFSKTMIAIAIISLVLTGLFLAFTPALVGLLGANEDLSPLTLSYITIFLYFQPLFMTGFALSYFVRVAGKPNLAGAALLISAISNIILDWLFITQLHWGIEGAAWATGISYALMFFTLIPFFISGKSPFHFQLKQKKWSDLKRSALNGFSEFSNEISIGITTLLFNWVMITRLGSEGVAAFAVINYSVFVGLMVSYAIGEALQPVISTHLGAKSGQRIKQISAITVFHLLLLAAVIITIVLFIPNTIIELFLESRDHQAIAITQNFIALFWPAFIFNGLNIACSAYFTAMHKPIHSSIIAISRSLLLPVIFLMTLPVFLDDTGIFLTIPITEFLTFLLASFLYIRNQPDKFF